MSRKHSSPPAWVTDFIGMHSKSELQYGVRMDTPYKVPNKNWKSGNREIRIREVHVKGTGIPASTWARYKSGQWNPGPKTIKKLDLYIKRYFYNRMRAVGASSQQARNIRYSHNIKKMRKTVDQYKEYVATIAANKGVDPTYIIWGMAASNTPTRKGWEQYIKSKKADEGWVDEDANAYFPPEDDIEDWDEDFDGPFDPSWFTD